MDTAKQTWSTEYALQRVKHICKGTYIGHSEKCEKTFIPVRNDIFVCNSCMLLQSNKKLKPQSLGNLAS
jgi:hypothetical protein